MKQLIIILLGLIGVAYGQSSPTSAKTRFVNGIYLGTKLDSYFAAADSNAIYWRADSALMAKYKGTARRLLFSNDSTDILSKTVRTFGDQNITGAKTFNTDASSTVFYGNSVTVGQMSSNDSLRYTTQLATLLRTTEINKGISGTYMQFRSTGDSSMFERAYTIPTYNTGYKYLFFSYGVNDSRNFLECDTASFRADYYSVLDTAISKGWPLSKIKLLTPTYWNDDTAYQYRNLDYVNVTKSIGSIRGVQAIDTYTSFVQFGTGLLMNADSIHPNDAGHTFIAKTIFGALAQYDADENGQTFNTPAYFNNIVKFNNLPIVMGEDTLLYVNNGVVKKATINREYLPLNGGSMRGPIDMDNNSIIDINQLIADTSLVNKSVIVGFDYANILTNGTTSRTAQLIQNLVGSYTIGLEGSTGGQLASGTSPYDAVIGSDISRKLHFITNGVSQGHFEHYGALNLSKSLITDSIKAKSSAGGWIFNSSGSRIAEFGLGGGTQWVNYGFAGYDANRSSTYTDRSFTDKRYVDSVAALTLGTVTSVSAGTGMSFTTITSSGAVNADTSVLATRAYAAGLDVAKANTSLNNVNGVLSSTYGGAGSVSGILKANGSGVVSAAVAGTDYQSPITNPVTGTGTSTFIPRWTSSSALGNSLLSQSGNEITLESAGQSQFYIKSATGNDAVIRYFVAGSEIGATRANATKYYIETGGTERFAISSAGAATLTNLSGTGDRLVQANSSGQLSASLAVASATYTPTITSIANISSTTAQVCYYTRVGDIVTVSGFVQTQTVSDEVITTLDISLPISSNFTSSVQLSGSALYYTSALGTQSGIVKADATNDRATITWIPLNGAGEGDVLLQFTFTYRVL